MFQVRGSSGAFLGKLIKDTLQLSIKHKNNAQNRSLRNEGGLALGKKFCVMMVWISLFQSLYRLIPIETAKINNPLLTNETGVNDLASLGRWQSQNSTPSVSDPKSYVLATDA